MFTMYTFYNHELVFRRIYQDFTQKKDELLKFKELLAESLPQSLAVASYASESLLFYNKAFQKTFNVSKDFNLLKAHLGLLFVDQSTIRDIGTDDPSSGFTYSKKDPLSLFDVIKICESDNYLGEKAVSLAASITRNKVRRSFEVTLKKVKWDNEDATAILFNDITYQENLIALKLANINKDKVIATISHELRTPLNGIIGILDITQKKVDDPEIVGYLSLCKDNAHLLLSLVNSILDMQQISTGKLRLSLSNVDIRKVVSSIIQLFSFQCKEKNISLEYNVHQDVPDTISTDENRLKQVLINLLGNAIKFTSKGSIKVDVILSAENVDNLQISVSDTGIGIKEEDRSRLFKMYAKLEDEGCVNRNGVGLGLTISNALVGHLNGGYDRHRINVESQYGVGSKFYFQIQRTLEEKKFQHEIKNDSIRQSKAQLDQGEFNSSKGLLIQKVQSNDGQQNEEDHLSIEFDQPNDFDEFFLPSNLHSNLLNYVTPKKTRLFSISRNDNEDSPSGDILSQSKDPQESTLYSPVLQKHPSLSEIVESALDILVVDDNPFNLLIAKNLIEELRCTVQTALGGHEAIDIVKKSLSQGVQFKAIFMDCQMPIIDGFQTTKALRILMESGEIPKIPIFAWTANNSAEDVNRCYEAGMVGHIAKPASKMDFAQIISKLS